MAKAEMIEIAIFPTAMPIAMMKLLTSIGPTGAAPAAEKPLPRICE